MQLHNAAGGGNVVNIRRLVAEGADVNLPGDDGARPLHKAAFHGHVDAVQVLVEVGAEVDASAADGRRPPLRHERGSGEDNTVSLVRRHTWDARLSMLRVVFAAASHVTPSVSERPERMATGRVCRQGVAYGFGAAR
jgi:hypothetical protein